MIYIDLKNKNFEKNFEIDGEISEVYVEVMYILECFIARMVNQGAIKDWNEGKLFLRLMLDKIEEIKNDN